MKHNLLKSVIISVILLMGVSNAWAEPWLCRSTAGGKIATKTVGDKLNNGNEWNYEYTTNGGWSSATDIQVYVGTSTSSYTTINAGWKSDDGGNRNVAANIGSVSFDKSGKWYAVGKYKADGKTAYTTKKDEWTNNTTLSMGSNDEPYWEVTPPAVSNFTVSVSGYLSGTGTSNDPYIVQYGKALTVNLSGSKAKTDANSTLQYNTSGTWNTTTSRTISNITSATKTSVTVKMRCHNSTASLSGTESSKTIYYRAQTFTVNISSAGNGTVSPPGDQQVNGNKFNITATPNTGYVFKQWNVTGGAKVASTTSASTTVTATADGTVTAVFEETTFVVRGGAKFGNTWEDNTHIMTKKNASEKIVYYTITLDGTNNIDNVSNSQFQFKIYDPKNGKWYGLTADGDQYWYTRGMGQKTLDGTGKNIEIRADVKGDYEIKVDYSAPTPKITVTYPQKSYYLSGSWDDWKGEYPIENTSVTIHLEKGEHSFLIFDYQAGAKYYGNIGKMERTNCSGWPMTDGAGNCRIDADITGDYTFTFDVSTKKLTVRYPILITLVRSEFGPYGIKYNGQSYFSHKDKDVIINVPYGATINFIEGQPYSDIYTGGIMQSAPVVDKKRQVELNQPFTVLNDVTFDDNYVTKVDQVAYLGIPNNNCDWDKNASYANFTWRFDSYDKFPMTNSKDKAEFAFEEDGVNYYKFTIPAGCNKFQIQRKQARNDDENNQNETFSHTCDHEYMVLNTGINCYMLDNGTFNKNTHTGHWCELPPAEGDYRLLYVEQVVEKDANGYTVITRKKAHPSDVVRASKLNAQGTIVSLHIYKDRKYQANLGGGGTYESSSNPEIILQKYNGNDVWEDVEWHMVYGPLETLPMMACLPGRKNASPGSDIDDLKYHDGIEVIKNDTLTHKYKGSGVWNFYIINNGTKVTLDLNRTHRYEGQYYIRTDAAFGGWNSYTGSDNHMTRSDVSMDHSNYSHYYCKWISNAGTNVKYTIANDYGMAISDTLEADATDIWGTPITAAQRMVGDDQLLPASANVRFSWNEKTNFQHRAYLAGSGEIGNRFLVVEGEDSKILNADGQTLVAAGYNKEDPRSNLSKNEEIFNDISNWVYYADVQLVPNAGLKVTAKYNEKVQYFVGQADQYNNTILKSEEDCSDKYLIRLLYDFKTNELISAYVPGGQEGKEIEAIETNLMLLRKENETPRQLSFNANNMKDVGKQAYGVLELTQATLIDNTQGKNIYERSLYWISFPFDVRITDIFGFGEYGKHWIIQSYDGAKRAANGLWTDSETNWVYHFDPNTLNAGTTDQGIMKRGVGYVVALDLDQIKADDLFVGRINTIALYFPSTNTITGHIVNETSVTIDVPEHVCTINRPTTYGDRRIKDSHWNVIGVPSYINAVGDFSGKINTITEDVKFYYQWDGAHDAYTPISKMTGVKFNSLNAYMVQFAGNLQWTNVLNEAPAGIAAKRNSDEMEQYHLCLELQQNGTEQDRTFIQLQEEEVTTSFDFNYDLCKIKNSGANIYSLIATDRDPIEVAGNVLPVQETVIPVGVVISTAGDYTFAMPDGTDGIVVELIDYETNTTTNLLLDNYTVNLGKGTFDNRFALHVQPSKVTTSVEDINTNSNGVKKYLIDGILYMQKDGVLYDAQGKLVR